MPSTIAIVDFAHCGTTMLAGICEILGVPMVGGHYEACKWEDLEIIEALQAGEETFAKIVARRNAQHEIWGFKFPGCWRFPWLGRIREPLYLAIWKDPVSVTQRRFGRGDARWLRKMLNTVRQMRESVEGQYMARLPVTTFSYLQAVLKPGDFVRQIAKIVGLAPSEDRVERAVAYIQPNTGRRRQYPRIAEYL